MGFGIVLIGCAFLLFELYGVDIVAYAALGYGFALLMPYGKGFKFSALFAGISIIPAVIKMLNVYKIIDMTAWGFTASAIINISLIFFSAACFISFYTAVEKLAKSCGDAKLASKCGIFIYMMLIISTFSIAVTIFTGTEFARNFYSVNLILRYVMIFANCYFAFCCYSGITTPKALKKEEEENRKLLQNKKKKEDDKNS